MTAGKLIGTSSTGDQGASANYFRLTLFQALATGKITEFRVYSLNSGNVKCALYVDNDGEPGALITAMNTGQAVTGGQWNTLTFTETPVTKDTYYWLAECFDTLSAIHTLVGSGTFRYKAGTYSTFTFPESAGSGFSAGNQTDCVAGWGILILLPSAIASAEAFGSPTVILAGNYIYPSAIASQEAFGSPTVLPGAVILQPSAIQSAEAFGSPQLNLKLFAQSIPTAEAFGAPLVIPGAVIIQPSAIASLEAFGTPLVFYDQVIIPTGIPSAEAFGTPTISFILLIKPPGIPSAEAFGTLKVLREIIHIILDGRYTQASPGVNRVYVIGKDADGNPVYGSSLNQDEIDLVGERLDFNQELSIPTTAKAADVAAAAVAKARLTGSRGFIVIPPNCGQELWDVIQVTDKPTAQSQQKYRVIAVGFDYEPYRHRYQHKLILGAP